MEIRQRVITAIINKDKVYRMATSAARTTRQRKILSRSSASPKRRWAKPRHERAAIYSPPSFSSSRADQETRHAECSSLSAWRRPCQ